MQVLWLVGLPLVLCGTMAPLACALWVFAISYIFVGIDEVGVQAIRVIAESIRRDDLHRREVSGIALRSGIRV